MADILPVADVNGAMNPPAAPSAADPLAELRDPTNGKLLGKFDDVQQLRDGYWNQQRVLTETHQREQALSQLLEQNRMSPSQRADSRRDPAEELQQYGVPIHPIQQMVRQEAEQLVEGKLGPLLKTLDARSTMLRDRPDYATREGQVMQFVQAHPNLASTFNAIAAHEPLAAMQYADTMFQSHSANVMRTTTAEQEAARAAAAMPGGNSAGASRSAVASVDREKALDEAIKQAKFSRNSQDEANVFSYFLGDRPLFWGDRPDQQQPAGPR